ncbi:MAG: hypothetical protein K2X69_14455 [Silvanigrellaceae bacterium]|nr:hypothetical protein [Silvanigrellaceae bacterium]
MKLIGRKGYFKWGNRVIAHEILCETPEEFEARTGIHLEDSKSVVCEVIDCLGQKIERQVGVLLNEPNYTSQEHLSSFMNQVKLIAKEDIQKICNNSQYNKNLLTPEEIGLNLKDFKHDNCWTNNFIGFIQIPDDVIVQQYNSLNFIALHQDNKLFVPVYVFEHKEEFFDSTDNDSFEKPWVVVFHGTDNSSSGQRFKTEKEAYEFVSEGFGCGFNSLRFYNS